MPTITPERWLFPPRAENCMPREEAMEFFGRQNWLGQVKVNDSRCVIYFNPQLDGTIEVQLFNRHAEPFRRYVPPASLIAELLEIYHKMGLKGHCRLDGGLLHEKHASIKDHVVLWDVLVVDGQLLLDTTYDSRYQTLLAKADGPAFMIGTCEVGPRLTEHVAVSRVYSADQWPTLWDTITETNSHYDTPIVEGVVYKRGAGRLERCNKEKSNADWQAKSRVTTGRHIF